MSDFVTDSAQQFLSPDNEGGDIRLLSPIEECSRLSTVNVRAIDHLLQTYEDAREFEKAANVSKFGEYCMKIEERLLKHMPLSDNQIDRIREINRSLRRQFYEVHGRRLGTFDKMFGG